VLRMEGREPMNRLGRTITLLVLPLLLVGCVAGRESRGFGSMAEEARSAITPPKPSVPTRLAVLSGTWQGLYPFT
jgi:hypothetical protein